MQNDPSETTRQSPNPGIFKAYLLGALHDGTYSSLHKTFRISQSSKRWLERLQTMFSYLGYKSWIYREGKNRSVYVLETTASFIDMRFDPLSFDSLNEQLAYVRGYFDAEGGIPRLKSAPLYIQLCQKNRREIGKIKLILEKAGIQCGKIHNPSKSVDPHYWRVYVRAVSHQDFIRKVSSWHPRKHALFQERMKI
jgi:hypothetical protein